MSDDGPSTRYHRFYDFSIDDEPVGFFEIEATPDRITQRAKFAIDDAVSTNAYVLQIADEAVTAFRTGADDEWRAMDDYPEDAYPLSAFPLLIPDTGKDRRYRPIDEGTGEVGAERVLRRSDDVVAEVSDGATNRSFAMDGSVPIEIDWGGAISRLRSGRDGMLAEVPVDY